MDESKQNQVSQALKNKLSKTLKKQQMPQETENLQEENHEQTQMSQEQIQAFRESLHNQAIFRMEKLLQKENQWKEQKNILVEFGTALFEKLDRIANALEKFTESGEVENETQ